MTDRIGIKSIWVQRPDGLERCIYDGSPDKEYTEPDCMWADWVDPTECAEQPLNMTDNTVEVSEEDALIECI